MKFEDFPKQGAWFICMLSFSNTTAGKVYFGVPSKIAGEEGWVSFFDDKGDYSTIGPYAIELRELPEEISEPEIPSQFSTQVGGDHYAKRGIQPLQYILANELDFCQGNVVKYVTRFRDKNGVQDLKKVIHYAMFLLEDEYGVRSKVDYSDEQEA